MKNYQILILLILLTSCSNEDSKAISPKQEASENIKTKSIKMEYPSYDFDTILSNGYHLSYKLKLGKEKLQSLTLMKGQKEIRELNEVSAGMLHKNLGYIGADLGDYFIFSQSFGSGNPTDIQIIEKETGKEIKKGSWVDDDTSELVVLYISNIHEKNEELRLYDIKNKKERTITDFNNCRCIEEVIFGMRGCVEIKSVSKNEIVLAVEYDNEKIIKKYYR